MWKTELCTHNKTISETFYDCEQFVEGRVVDAIAQPFDDGGAAGQGHGGM
jgi:hypothetical protein